MKCSDCMHMSLTRGCMVAECEFPQPAPVWVPIPFDVLLADEEVKVVQIDLHDVVWGDEEDEYEDEYDWTKDPMYDPWTREE